MDTLYVNNDTIEAGNQDFSTNSGFQSEGKAGYNGCLWTVNLLAEASTCPLYLKLADSLTPCVSKF
jgi:hypothetical protein